jgi:multidrug transporter EmrE-like cation transporter
VRTLPLHVSALLVLTPLMVAAGQVMFKMTGTRLGSAPVQSVLLSPVFISALAIYGGATLLWVYVLKSVPLSYAYSFMALTFIAVPLLGHVWFAEPLDAKYFIGMGLVLAGLLTLWS